ncbi:MAG TPA: hypothetical protein VJQ82_24755 [Terriglobales bacterium]|nr:hypothetical protein [Terriglobales bacterium]
MPSLSMPEPTLSSRAMLCSLSISQWSASKHDPQISEEIAVHHGAQPDVGRYNKLLIPKETLAEVRRIAGEARREHYFMTLPWDDNGYRVLPAAVYMEHTEKLRAYSGECVAAVEVFATQFDQLVVESRSRLGGLFRPEDYPASKEIRDKFGFETKVLPLPDANDFRVSLGNEEKDRIKRQITASVEASLNVASRELWQRLYEAVSHMAERLSAYKTTELGVEHPFRDSIVTNMVKLVDLMPRLNITGDPELERLTSQVRASLLVDPEQLRQSESIRADTAMKAARIAQQMSAYMGGYQPAAVAS